MTQSLHVDGQYARRRRGQSAAAQLEKLGIPPGWELKRLNGDKHWQLRRPGLIVNWYPTTDRIHPVGADAARWIALEVDQATQGLSGYARIERIARRMSEPEISVGAWPPPPRQPREPLSDERPPAVGGQR